MTSINLTKVKLSLSSLAVLFIAATVKVMAPLVAHFWHNQAPLMWSSFSFWLKPPYLYLVINCIIIVIVFSSRLKDEHEDFTIHPIKSTASIGEDSQVFNETAEEEKGGASEVVRLVEPPPIIDSPEKSRRDSYVPNSSEKPLVSTRFKHSRSSPEGTKKLRVMKPKRTETLENTWKAITEGKAMPLTRHLKKSEGAEGNLGDRGVRKARTFHDRTNQQSAESPPSGKVRKEPSLSNDELNRRVEAFIRKFNDDMRMQRQESLNQYHQMINKGLL